MRLHRGINGMQLLHILLKEKDKPIQIDTLKDFLIFSIRCWYNSVLEGFIKPIMYVVY